MSIEFKIIDTSETSVSFTRGGKKFELVVDTMYEPKPGSSKCHRSMKPATFLKFESLGNSVCIKREGETGPVWMKLQSFLNNYKLENKTCRFGDRQDFKNGSFSVAVRCSDEEQALVDRIAQRTGKTKHAILADACKTGLTIIGCSI